MRDSHSRRERVLTLDTVRVSLRNSERSFKTPSVDLHCARLDCHAFNVFALGTDEGEEVEIRRLGHDATEHHRHPALRARAIRDFIGC
jgi:hypothetical protein